MALKEVKLADVDKRSYCKKMLDEFMDSDMDAALVEIPEGAKIENIRLNIYNLIKRHELKDKVSTRRIGDNIYLLKK